MKRLLLAGAALSAVLAAPVAQSATANYNIETTWFEPDESPDNTFFLGSFTYDDVTKTVTNLQGVLSEAMYGDGTGSYEAMPWLNLDYQLVSWYDATLGGTFAATFRNTDTTTFSTLWGQSEWEPGGEVVYAGFPVASANPGNAYALIFVPDDPLTSLTQAQIDMLAYADCAEGGMMGATCMTGTSLAGYGVVGTMGGYPISQTITAAVPEPGEWALMLLGLGMLGFKVSRQRSA